MRDAGRGVLSPLYPAYVGEERGDAPDLFGLILPRFAESAVGYPLGAAVQTVDEATYDGLPPEIKAAVPRDRLFQYMQATAEAVFAGVVTEVWRGRFREEQNQRAYSFYPLVRLCRIARRGVVLAQCEAYENDPTHPPNMGPGSSAFASNSVSGAILKNSAGYVGLQARIGTFVSTPFIVEEFGTNNEGRRIYGAWLHISPSLVDSQQYAGG